MVDFTRREQAVIDDFAFRCTICIWDAGAEYRDIVWEVSDIGHMYTVYVVFTLRGNKLHVSKTIALYDMLIDEFEQRLRELEATLKQVLELKSTHGLYLPQT